MKKFALSILFIFVTFISSGCAVSKIINSDSNTDINSGYIEGKKFYISEDKQYDSKFLCFAKDDCYNVKPDKIEIKNKTFLGFGLFNYYDIDTYKYNKYTDTYTVDMAVDRDPSTDLGYYSKCPYDKGNITHLIFSITYIPSKKIFKAEYKGFISSEDILIYQNNEPRAIETNYLNIYYDNNPDLIEELNQNLKYYNVEVPQTLNDRNNGGYYAAELEYVLRYYLATNHLT